MSALRGLLRWVYLIELIAEVSLGIVAFLAENDVFYPSPLAWSIVEFIMFGVNLALWLLVAFCLAPSGGQRGSSLLRADTVYFAMTTTIHFFLSIGWITFLARSFGVAPLNWSANPATFAVFRALFSRQYTFVVLLVIFSLFDTRYTRLRSYVASKARSMNQ